MPLWSGSLRTRRDAAIHQSLSLLHVPQSARGGVRQLSTRRWQSFRWLSGQALVATYSSSPGNLRAFCSVCGSNMPVLEDEGAHVIIPAGTLDDDPKVRPIAHIHIASKAPWYEISDTLPRFAVMPPQEFWVPYERAAP